MLVLIRKLRERVLIGDMQGVVIDVLSLDRGTVKLGITADASIPIFREELVDQQNKRKKDQNNKSKREQRRFLLEKGVLSDQLNQGKATQVSHRASEEIKASKRGISVVTRVGG